MQPFILLLFVSNNNKKVWIIRCQRCLNSAWWINYPNKQDSCSCSRKISGIAQDEGHDKIITIIIETGQQPRLAAQSGPNRAFSRPQIWIPDLDYYNSQVKFSQNWIATFIALNTKYQILNINFIKGHWKQLNNFCSYFISGLVNFSLILL